MREFNVYHPDYLGDGHETFRAFDHEDAAEQYAEWYDTSGDYTLAQGATEEVIVEDENGQRVKFIISAEPTVSYCARKA